MASTSVIVNIAKLINHYNPLEDRGSSTSQINDHHSHHSCNSNPNHIQTSSSSHSSSSPLLRGPFTIEKRFTESLEPIHQHDHSQHWHLPSRLVSSPSVPLSSLFLLPLWIMMIATPTSMATAINSSFTVHQERNLPNNNSNIAFEALNNHHHHLFSAKNLTSSDMEMIFVSIFNEINFEDALIKMTNVWKQFNPNGNISSSSSSRISSSSFKSSSSSPPSHPLPQEQIIQNDYVLNNNRSRRWTSNNGNGDGSDPIPQISFTGSDHITRSEDSMIKIDNSKDHGVSDKLTKQKNQNRNGTDDMVVEEEEENYDDDDDDDDDDNGGENKKSKIIKLNISCSRCSRDERERSLRIEAIKMNILNKLNMEHPPNVSLKDLPRIPPINMMLNKLNSMYNDDAGIIREMPKYISKIVGNDYFGPLPKFNLDDEEEYFVHTSKSVVFSQKPPADRIIDGDLHVQYFKFPANLINNNVAKAYLWLYVKGMANIKANFFVVLYQVVRESTPLQKFKTKRLVNTGVRKGGWISIRVEKLITKWMDNPQDNLGLVVHAYDSSGHQITIIHSDDVQPDSSLRPYIELLVDNSQPPRQTSNMTGINIRQKRTVGLNCEDKSSEVRCCRYPLTVDFEQFGWDWIIAPKRYQANYCSGECPFVLMNQYPHTHLIQQINKNAIGPCCSPRKMSSISMLYMDADYNVIYGIVPNMIVDRCGCS